MLKAQKISHAAFFLVILGIISIILGYLRELFLAYRFGVSGTTDSFLVAIVPISLLVYFVRSADIAFVARFSKGIVKDEKKTWLSGSRIVNIALFSTIILGLIVFLFTPLLAKTLAPGFSQEKLALVSTLIRLSLPALLTIPLFIFIKGILNSYKQFTLPEIAALLPNLGVIFGILVLSLWLGVKGAVIGLTLGYVLQFLIPGIKILPFLFKNYSFSASLRDPEVRKFFFYTFCMILIMAGLNIDLVADKIFGSFLPTGSIAALNYARRIVASVYFLIAYALSTTLLPTLSQYHVLNNQDKFKDLFQKGIRMMIFILLPTSFLIFILREPIINILFKHGAFDKQGLLMTSSVLAIYSGAILALAGITFLARIFYALDDIKIPALIGVLIMITNIIFDFIFIKYFSFRGLALATLVAANLNFLFSLIYLWYKFKILKMKEWTTFISKILIAFISMVLVALVVDLYFKNIFAYEFFKSVLQIIVIAGIAIIVFLAVAYGLKMEEILQFKYFINSFTKKIKGELKDGS